MTSFFCNFDTKEIFKFSHSNQHSININKLLRLIVYAFPFLTKWNNTEY